MQSDKFNINDSLFSVAGVSYILYIFVLVFTPLAFGTVETWSWTVLELTTGLSILLLGLSYFLAENPGVKIPGFLPLLLLLGYMLFQLIPLPVDLVKIISPSTFEIYKPLLEISDNMDFIPLTVHRKATLLLLFNFTAYGLIYVLTIYHCSHPQQLKRTAAIVIILGIVIGFEAILQKLTSPGLIYWFRPTPNSNPVGPWVYSNHFAGYMEMVFPLAIALFLFHRPQVKYSKTLREKFISVMTMPGANRHLLLGTGAILMAVSILLSISRGGIITLSLAFLFFVLFTARIMQDNKTLWAIVLTVIVVFMISWLGWDPILQKFSRIWGVEGIDTSGRLPVLLDSVQIFRAFPFSGTGFGTFVDVYPSVRTVPGEAIFDHAHNDYIELLVTGGVVGFVLAGCFLISVLIKPLHMLRIRRDRYAVLMTSAAVTGILAELFHCVADFQLYNGANGLYLFFLCGIAVSASHTRLHYRSRPTLLTETSLRIPVSVGIIGLLLLCSSSWYKLNAYRAELAISTFDAFSLDKELSQETLLQLRDGYGRAADLDMLEATYPFSLGIILNQLENNEQAHNAYQRALSRRPASGLYLQQIAINHTSLGSEEKKILLDASVRRAPYSLDIYLNYATWLLVQGQRQESFAVLNSAMDRIPWRIKNIVDFIYPFRFSEEEIRDNLANTPAAWYEIGRSLQAIGLTEESTYYYEMAIKVADGQKLQSHYFSVLYWLYKKQKDDKKALEILKLGIDHLPDYAPLRIWMGDYYLQNDIPYRAREEYTQALRLDPRNMLIKKKLEQLDQE